MREFRQIAAWQKAHELTLAVYRSCAAFPATETFGLRRQLTRAAGSIGANIAEGFGRGGDSELCRFLQIAIGSAFELENHLLLARDLGLLDSDRHRSLEEKTREVQRMLGALIRKIKADLLSRKQ